MQTTAGHFNFPSHEQQAPSTYEGYDNYESGYGSPVSSREGAIQWKSPTAVNDHYDDYNNFANAIGDATTHQISVDTRVRSPNHDAVGRHLLYETALLDTHHYEVLDINEVDELKTEHERLDARIEAASRKLVLENKLKEAAQNIQRLYHSKKDSRPDTPQSPGSPKKTRGSLSGNRGRTSSSSASPGGHSEQAKEEVARSVKTVDELNETIKTLLERRAVVERKLLRHTAAVIAEQATQSTNTVSGKYPDGHQHADDDGTLYTPNEFDGIRDILHGKPVGQANFDGQKLSDEYEQRLLNMQNRLEHFNSQLRGVIVQAAKQRGNSIEPEIQTEFSHDPADNLEISLNKLEDNLHILEQEQHGHQESRSANRVEEQLVELNTHLHSVLINSASKDLTRDLHEPPVVGGHGYQHQLQYMEESFFALERVLQQQTVPPNDQVSSEALEQVNRKADLHAQKAAEYETVLAGLWEIMSSEKQGPQDGSRSPLTPLKEDFSIQAFNSRVQHLIDVASSAKEQQDILRRQIQQQRDLNGKSDMEKDREIAEMQIKHDELTDSHSQMQDELTKVIVSHQQTQQEASESRAELVNVMDECERLRQLLREKQTQLQEHNSQLLAQQSEAQNKDAQIQRDIASLETEVVRLTTELTVAKADLEGAYGTRAQRQKEAGVAAGEFEALQDNYRQATTELEQLREQHTLLENELQEMTQEFQEMTRESLELEKERGQLESLIDGLRDRCDALEGQLADEKMRFIGVKSPASGTADGPAVRENMSVMVLRQEFKRMMREARLEGVKLIRTEQEERRKLEAELRKIRQANGPLGRQHSNGPFSPTRSNTGLSTPA
ncbi:uncharacterized protein K489DRAFT_358426 [Dissoconium aciculare CBS 342.82]|uniref:Up-regulated during septation protein 1 domain-containing protein n=1 Tax=Dissoconium aciculare CBS 342.82 TaxID=1314786 RepID=A0A6J3M2T8_9PEZI|nr:uncharacterized protein K489DRAFT_358426 [Dissoconium aciculare CBS 342.82]KAF1822305.1 hypothetical protein K489DRAFT_358426 [Dissoconium aciculare CBS 342.82]